VRNPEADARQWALIAHVLAGITTFLGPLIIWAIKKDEHPFAKDQTTEALNFGITLALTQLALSILDAILPGLFFSFLIGLVRFAVWVGGLVFAIQAGLKARDGVPYRYPYTLRLLT
jgi:uncharacterized Tic20 family protein